MSAESPTCRREIVDAPGPVFCSPADAERSHALLHDLRNTHARIQRGVRILEDDLEFAPARSQCCALQPEQIDAIEFDASARHGHQRSTPFADRGLAAPRLADQRQRATGGDSEGHAIHGLHLSYHAAQ